jgi:hypothetical protein
MTAKLATLADVAQHLGASEPTNDAIRHRVYKDTDCGAWAQVIEAELGNGLVFRVGSIIEGSEALAGPIEVPLPATAQEIDDAIEAVEDEAEELWHEAQNIPREEEEEEGDE